MLYALLLRGAYADKVLQGPTARESGLDYTIVRPTRLTTAAGTRPLDRTGRPWPLLSSIARADVARFILDALGTREYVGKTVSLGGRTRPTEPRRKNLRDRALLLFGFAGRLHQPSAVRK